MEYDDRKAISKAMLGLADRVSLQAERLHALRPQRTTEDEVWRGEIVLELRQIEARLIDLVGVIGG